MPRAIDLSSDEGIERGADGLPTAIRIWVPGPNALVDGSFDLFDERSADLLREQAALGRLYSFDYNHATFRTEGAPDPARAAEACGWHRIEVRDNGECWLAVDEWIEPAPERILSKKYRYLSPVFDADEDGRIVRYTNCALTNVPMTLNAIALRARAESKAMDWEKILTALGFTSADWDGKTEDEIAEMIRAALGEPAPDSQRAEGEPAEGEQRADGAPTEGEQRAEGEAPAGGEQRAQRAAPAPARAPGRRVAAGFAPASGTPITRSEPKRNPAPTTQGGSKNVMRSVGINPSTNAASRRRAQLPECAPETLKLQPWQRFNSSKDLVILRNTGDALHFERSEDQKEMIRNRYAKPALGR